jgi:tetratricopeptide (TPR) repeat protein
VVALVAAAAVLAAVVVGLAAIAGGDPAEEAGPAVASEPLPGRPAIVVEPLPGMPADPSERVTWAERLAARDPGAETALRLAAAQLGADDPEAARATLEAALADDPDDLRLRSARALADYDAADPVPVLVRLDGIVAEDPELAFPRFTHGVALLWAGRRAEGESQLRTVRDAAPESFLGVAADDLLHPAMPSGYPPFITASEPRAADLEAAAEAAAANPADAVAQVEHAAALVAAGRRAEAVRAFDAALAVDPGLVEARVGRIVAGFRKDEPEVAFGQLGPLVRDHPGDPSPRVHLGLLLLWLRDPETARAQFRQVAETAPGTRLGRAAGEFLQAL